MSRTGEYFASKYNFDELADFADYCGMDFDLFESNFWDFLTFEDDVDAFKWIMWNWIDCSGEIDIMEIWEDYWSFANPKVVEDYRRMNDVGKVLRSLAV